VPRAVLVAPWAGTMAGKSGAEATALQALRVSRGAQSSAPASWSAPVLWRFWRDAFARVRRSTVRAFLGDQRKSGRGLPHSKARRAALAHRNRASVMECASPLALLEGRVRSSEAIDGASVPGLPKEKRQRTAALQDASRSIGASQSRQRHGVRQSSGAFGGARAVGSGAQWSERSLAAEGKAAEDCRTPRRWRVASIPEAAAPARLFQNQRPIRSRAHNRSTGSPARRDAARSTLNSAFQSLCSSGSSRTCSTFHERLSSEGIT